MAAGAGNSVRVRIAGEEHVIRGEATEEYIRRLASLVDQQLTEILDAHPNVPRHRAAILVAMNLADELEKLKEEYHELLALVEDAR